MTRAWAMIRFVVAFELKLWASLLRWIFRRPRVAPGGRAFPYTAVVAPVLWAFIGVSAVELPVLHLLLPWPTVRFVADLVSVYGLLWMLGLMASLRVHPHVLEESGLRLRYGFNVDIVIPWDAVASIRARTRGTPKSRSIQVERADVGLILSVVVASRTDVELVLREPRPLPVPQTNGEPVSELRFAVDDPKSFLAAARARQADAGTRAI